jgi:hypothetical protein
MHVSCVTNILLIGPCNPHFVEELVFDYTSKEKHNAVHGGNHSVSDDRLCETGLWVCYFHKG